jgi:hypothetical protein
VSEYLDHIIYASADLERGSRQFEALTGVTPSYGGVHANGTTQNAIVALDGRCYLEILAPVKGAQADDDQWTRLARGAETPRVLTYCMRTVKPLPENSVNTYQAHLPSFRVELNTPRGPILFWICAR